MIEERFKHMIEIKSYGGRLMESRKPIPDKNSGLYGILNVLPLNLNGNKIETARTDFMGEAVLVTDSSGNTFLVHVKRNRFVTIARNLKTSVLQFLDHNYVFFALASAVDKNIHIYNDNGNEVEALKGHRGRVADIGVNFLKEVFFSLSKDCLILWHLKSFKKARTLYPKKVKGDGKSLAFRFAQFTSDGDYLLTRFNTGLTYFWNLATFEMEKEVDLSAQGHHLAWLMSDCDSLLTTGKGGLIDHITQSTSTISSFKLPYKNKAALKVESLNSSRVIVVLCQDYRIYFIDPDRKYSIIQILAQRLRGFCDFWLDKMREMIVCLTTEGELYIYHLPTLIEVGLSSQTQRLAAGENLAKVQTLLELVDSRPFEATAGAGKSNLGPGGRPLEQIQLQYQSILKNLPLPARRANNISKSSTNHLGSTNQNSLVSGLGETTDRPPAIGKINQKFDLKNLRIFLAKNKVYPNKYRALIWSFLLDLPENFVLYNNYLKRGEPDSLKDFSTFFPLKSEKLTQKMRRIMSVLAAHSSVFSDLNIVPSVVFPFVKLFSKDECLATEVSLSFFMHWGQHFFEDHPQPSSAVVVYLEAFLQKYDFEVYNHLRNRGCPLAKIAWPSMTNLYTDLMTKQDWLRLWDTLVSYPEYPELFHLFFATELIIQREVILGVNQADQLKSYLNGFGVLDVGVTLQKAVFFLGEMEKERKLANGSASGVPELKFNLILPLGKKVYQPYTFIPKNLL